MEDIITFPVLLHQGRASKKASFKTNIFLARESYHYRDVRLLESKSALCDGFSGGW